MKLGGEYAFRCPDCGRMSYSDSQNDIPQCSCGRHLTVLDEHYTPNSKTTIWPEKLRKKWNDESGV